MPKDVTYFVTGLRRTNIKHARNKHKQRSTQESIHCTSTNNQKEARGRYSEGSCEDKEICVDKQNCTEEEICVEEGIYIKDVTCAGKVNK